MRPAAGRCEDCAAGGDCQSAGRSVAKRASEPRFERALAVPEVSLHLYEKHTARAARKMGHLSATADTAEEAVARVLEAKSRL